jgi:hypothetical protein
MHATSQIGDAVLQFGGLCVAVAVILGLYWSKEETT